MRGNHFGNHNGLYSEYRKRKDRGSKDVLRSLVKDTAIMFCILFMVAMTWEAQKTDAAIAEGPIPQESIRLRILANSDNPDDQLVKREIRDAVIAEMNGWVMELDDPQSLEQARETIREHLPELDELVGRELQKRGIGYHYLVELGVVPFPTKLYGGTVYPAGNYEALRITLGEGRGQNWWCVLFPPLCFIDAGSGDAAAQPVQSNAGQADSKKQDKMKPAAAKASSTQNQPSKLMNQQNGSQTADAAGNDASPAAKTEVRFFLWDMIQGLFSWIAGIFS